MARVITFSTKFPSYHQKAGQPTYFVEKFWNSACRYMNYYEICTLNEKQGDELLRSLWPFWNTIKKHGDCADLKNHTIRAGNRWKAGDKFSPRIWSGKPYNSKQIIIGPDIEVKRVFDFCIDPFGGEYRMDGHELSFDTMKEIARNDGFDNLDDLELWFNIKRSSPGFRGQIICWNETIKY